MEGANTLGKVVGRRHDKEILVLGHVIHNGHPDYRVHRFGTKPAA